MIEIKEFFEKIGEHIQERKTLRELLKESDITYVRIFDDCGGSETTKFKGSLFAFDGFYGGYTEMGGEIEVIGCNREGQITNSVRLGGN